MTEGREKWESSWRWASERPLDFELDEVPEQLAEFCAANAPIGMALDIGCGSGLSTAYLAKHSTFAIGADLSERAVALAKQRAEAEDIRASFVVADALHLPFRSDAFSLVFDRGCVQTIPVDLWPRYFAEVDTAVNSSGAVVVMYSGLAPASVRSRAPWRRRAKSHRVSHDDFRRIRPASMRVERLEDFPFTTRKGRERIFTHAVLRR